MNDKNPEPKPFHKSIVDFIAEADEDCMVAAAGIIKRTSVPDDHEVIKQAWQQRLLRLGQREVDYGVPAYLDGQQAKAEEKKAAAKQAAAELDLGPS